MPSSPRSVAAARLLRLSLSAPDELAAALHAHGADGASLGLPSPPSPPPPGAVLDAVFAALAPPPRPPLPPAPLPPHARPALPAARIADDPGLVRAVLAHPPRSLPRGRPAAVAAAAAPPPAATAIAAQLAAQPAPPLRQVPQNVPGHVPQRAPPPHPVKHAAPPTKPMAPQRRRLTAAEPDAPEIDVDRELDFEASLARDVAARAQREDRKRPRITGGSVGGGGGRGYDSCRDRGKVSRRRGAIVLSDEEDEDEDEDQYRSGHGSRADRELNRTLASNPYNAAFNAGMGGGGFRTASSKLAADRRAAGKRPRHRRRGDDGDGGGREDFGSDGDDVVRTVHRAVLGPARRPKFNAPRSNTAKKKEAEQDEDATTRDDLPEIPNIEPKLVEMIMNEALDKSPNVQWDGTRIGSCSKRRVRRSQLCDLLVILVARADLRFGFFCSCLDSAVPPFPQTLPGFTLQRSVCRKPSSSPCCDQISSQDCGDLRRDCFCSGRQARARQFLRKR